MSNDRVKEIKNEDKKAFKHLVVSMLIALIAGGIFGVMIGHISSTLKDILGESVPRLMTNVFYSITPFASIALSILVIIINAVVYKKSRKEYILWKETSEDEDLINKVEKKLSYVMLFTAVNLILTFFFFGMGAILLPFDNFDGGLSNIKFICFMGGFIFAMISTILIQQQIFNFEKEINPLLKVSIYEKKFRQKFIDNCDEAAKLEIYKSAYKAYTSVSKTLMILWILSIIGSWLWDFGVMPMVIVTIIWLVQTISYCIESMKY